jgi:hypothetical protein
MAQHHHPEVDLSKENVELPPEAANVGRGALIFGLLCLGAAFLLGILNGSPGRLQQIMHSYLTSFAFYLALSLGALFFVMVQHLARAHWSVTVRRVAEYMACNLLVLFFLGAPIGWYAVASRTPAGAPHGERTDIVVTGGLYPWTDAAHVMEDPILRGKAGWLNVPMWTVRILIYFAVWILLAYYFRNKSLQQDSTGDVKTTLDRESYSAPGLLAFAISLTLGAIDILMSLNPHWFSTMFGVYFFAGGAGAFFATFILALMLIQKFGRLRGIVTLEHYHDLGKFLFGFVFFWGYIAFSQYMLIWYSNIPEETEWFRDRQYIHPTDVYGPWTTVGLVLLFIHVLIPFPGLISRRVKRNMPALAFWCIWMLVAHFVDMYWVVMPEYSKKVHVQDRLPFQMTDALIFLGIGGVLVWNFLRQATTKGPLVATKDPRFGDSVAFQNF